MALCQQSDYVSDLQSKLRQQCNLLPCETFSTSAGIWGECSKTCGGGQRVRSFKCLSSRGYTAARLRCTDTPTTVETCNTNVCGEHYYTTSPFSGCSARCDGGIKERTVTCVDKDGAAVDDSLCAALVKPVASKVCNTKACVIAVWKVGQWSACPATCGGMRERTTNCQYASCCVAARKRPHLHEHTQYCCVCSVLDAFHCCRYADGSPVAAADTASACPAAAPSPTEACEPCSFCEDDTQNQGCSGQGICTDEMCMCEPPFGGPTCAVDLSTCASGVKDSRNQCCESGVTDLAGVCCAASGSSAPVLDGLGQCCARGSIDACGVCGGNALVVDIQNICCPVRVEGMEAKGRRGRGRFCESGRTRAEARQLTKCWHAGLAGT